jgi:hypothetical protein
VGEGLADLTRADDGVTHDVSPVMMEGEALCFSAERS